MKKIELFNKEIFVKDFLCGPTPISRYKVEPALRLYIKVTDYCNANCKFCANGACTDFGKIDLEKLEFVIRYLKDNNRLHSISLTGGEPMINPDLVNKILNLIWSIDSRIEVQISTNGLNLREISNFDNPNNLESIHISRHHYDDNKNILESVKDNPFSVIIVDELEKAHSNIINLFYQILENSKIRDSKGDFVYFNNSIIIMTSNVGSLNNFLGFTPNSNSINRNLKARQECD